MPTRRDHHTLDHEIVTDDQRLWEILNDVILAVPGYQRKRRKVIKQQEKLRALVDDEAWAAYMKIEQLVNDRNQAVVTAIARWAFSEGLRSCALPRG